LTSPRLCLSSAPNLSSSLPLLDSLPLSAMHSSSLPRLSSFTSPHLALTLLGSNLLGFTSPRLLTTPRLLPLLLALPLSPSTSPRFLPLLGSYLSCGAASSASNLSSALASPRRCLSSALTSSRLLPLLDSTSFRRCLSSTGKEFSCDHGPAVLPLATCLGLTIGDAIMSVLAVHRKITDADKEFITGIMQEGCVDGKVSQEMFEQAVIQMGPHMPMNEGTMAYIFSRAVALDCRIVMQKVSAIQKGAAIMESPDIVGKTPSVAAMVAAFCWNFGIYCAGGVRKDGSYLVEEFRQKAKGTEQVLGGGAKKEKKK
ncbi:hypothetical protein CYMTET_23911, partial [Cymbomonas tetramitiformis]